MEREGNTSLFLRLRLFATLTTLGIYFAFGIGGECGNCGNCGVDVAAEGAHSELESSVAVLVILYIPSLLETKKSYVNT